MSDPSATSDGQIARGALFGIGATLGLLVVVITSLAVNIFTIDDGYVTWPREGSGGTQEAASGGVLAEQQGCLACHSTDGSVSTGPTWFALAGAERQLEGGATTIADAVYLERSIVEPRADVVAGYPASVMPTNYADALSPGEIDAMVAYIESLHAEEG